MTQDVAAPRRRIGLKGPLTGLVLIGLVVYGAYWGWERAFGDGGGTTVASTSCPTAPVAPSATVSPAALSIGTARLAVSSARLGSDGAARAAFAAAPTPLPSVTGAPAGPIFLTPAEVDVSVLNASGRRGLAANTAAVLRDRGFTVVLVDNAPSDDVVPEVAQVRAATADSPAVRLLVQHVPGAAVVADGRPNATVDLVLGDQFESLGDPAVVTPVPVPSRAC